LPLLMPRNSSTPPLVLAHTTECSSTGLPVADEDTAPPSASSDEFPRKTQWLTTALALRQPNAAPSSFARFERNRQLWSLAKPSLPSRKTPPPPPVRLPALALLRKTQSESSKALFSQYSPPPKPPSQSKTQHCP